jgi:hypothetical protein
MPDVIHASYLQTLALSHKTSKDKKIQDQAVKLIDMYGDELIRTAKSGHLKKQICLIWTNDFIIGTTMVNGIQVNTEPVPGGHAPDGHAEYFVYFDWSVDDKGHLLWF